MMGDRQVVQGALFYEFCLEEYVPANHMLRSIDRLVELSEVRAHLAPFYSSTGRPSVDLFHGRPIQYVRAFNSGARTVGSILLQFPLYGGIMGAMTHTALAAVIAQSFVSFLTQHTLAFWSFISSNIITLFVPSGGGHWAVQGPFMVPAAVKLHTDPAVTAMATAMGEQTANMIQPFWALPILGLAQLGIKDIMGYCVIALIIGLVFFGGSLLIFA